MSFIKRARRARVSKVGVAFVAALAMGTTSAAIWAATTASAATPDTIWGTSTPANAAVDSDTGAVELGTRFTPVTAGQATGVRFYKTVENRGTHTGALWTSTGTLLAKVSFTSESSTGWQTATFSKPVSLNVGTSYVVSYHTSYGRYFATERFSGSSASANLQIPSSNVGVYAYGTTSNFPTNTWHASQYWVDLTFAKTGSPVTAPSSTATKAPSSSITPTAASTSTSIAPSASVSSTSATPTATTTTAKATVTVTPTAASSSTSSSSTGLSNCVSLPSRCGYPDATNTGVAAGTTLRRVPQDVSSGPGWTWSGSSISAGDNAIVENLIIPGSVEVSGKNVIVRNNQFTVTGETWAVATRHAANVTISNNKIGVTGAPRLMVGIKDIYSDSTGTQIVANDISNTSTGVQIDQGLIAGNYIHDLGYKDGDHLNGITSNQSTGQLTIRGNTVLNNYSQTDAVSLFQDFGKQTDRLITGNLLAGGGYTIYGGDNRNYGVTSNIKITNNRFSPTYYANSGYWGAVAYYDNAGTGNEFSGNIWDNNGQTVE